METAFDVELKVRKEINLVEDHDLAGSEDMRVLYWFVFAVGYRHDDHLGSFAQVEQSGANQIADILDHHDGMHWRIELCQAAGRHVRFQMTASAGVDLHNSTACRLNSLGIVKGCLVAFDHGNRQLIGQVANGPLQERGLSRPRLADQVQREDVSSGEPAAVAFGEQAVFGE